MANTFFFQDILLLLCRLTTLSTTAVLTGLALLRKRRAFLYNSRALMREFSRHGSRQLFSAEVGFTMTLVM